MLILGIETSCDETAVALYDSDKGLLGHFLHSQVEIHAKFGGVVPELASRDHIRKLLPLTKQLLDKVGVSLQDLDAICYTKGPGLVGALLVGAAFAKSLAFALDIPAIATHHMEAHLLAPMLEGVAAEFPFVALLVSGGHTLLVEVKEFGKYKVLGESVDDAVGEAFDKVAKILGLPYPGGPALAKLALQGDSKRFTFPRPMTKRPGLDFSFSGLKTFALNTLHTYGDDDKTKADIACAFQEAAVDTLRIKCERALLKTNSNVLVIGGGVSANKLLRQELSKMVKKNGAQVFYPRLEFCTDNAAMIAYLGMQKLVHEGKKAFDKNDLAIEVKPRWSLENRK